MLYYSSPSRGSTWSRQTTAARTTSPSTTGDRSPPRSCGSVAVPTVLRRSSPCLTRPWCCSTATAAPTPTRDSRSRPLSTAPAAEGSSTASWATSRRPEMTLALGTIAQSHAAAKIFIDRDSSFLFSLLLKLLTQDYHFLLKWRLRLIEQGQTQVSQWGRMHLGDSSKRAGIPRRAQLLRPSRYGLRN